MDHAPIRCRRDAAMEGRSFLRGAALGAECAGVVCPESPRKVSAGPDPDSDGTALREPAPGAGILPGPAAVFGGAHDAGQACVPGGRGAVSRPGAEAVPGARARRPVRGPGESLLPPARSRTGNHPRVRAPAGGPEPPELPG